MDDTVDDPVDDLVDGGDKAVRAQYEAYPYPARDPADEAHRLITGSPSHILEIEHFVLRGGRAGDLRALVAGGGTGDGAIMLAQQLADLKGITLEEVAQVTTGNLTRLLGLEHLAESE